MTNLPDIWVYLSAKPLLHLTLTLIAYRIGLSIFNAMGRHPAFNPVLIAVLLLVPVLWATGTKYETYFAGAQFVHFLLGPATVALAVPLFRHLGLVRRSFGALFTSVLLGSAAASISAVILGKLLGASPETLISLAPKSVTTPVAMAITEELGGLPSLTAALVMVTGILGASMMTNLLDLLRIRSWASRGLAAGTSSHGLGMARAFQVNEVAGVFAGIAMGLNALLSAVLVPVVWKLLFAG